MSSLATKLKTAARHPELVGTRVRSRWNLVPYFVGDGSNAFTPSTVYVSVNSVCNMKCKMCDVGTATVGSQFWLNLLGPKSEISLENAKRIVDDVKSFKPVLAINSTEPLLYRHIVPMVEHAKAAGLEVQITTNGLRLEKFAEQFVDLGLDRLWISLDGPAATHDHIRGVKNGFQRITDAIKLLTELKRQRGKATPRVFINFTVSEFNFDQAVPLMEAISGIGISGVTISHMNFVTEAMADVHNGMYGHVVKATPSSVTLADPQRIELTALGDQIDELRARWPGLVAFTPELQRHELDAYYNDHEVFVRGRRCFVPWQSAQILANGDLVPISRCFNIPVGNVFETTFAEAWSSDPMKSFRRELKSVGAFPACTRCCGILG